jgi:hypothetical protein
LAADAKAEVAVQIALPLEVRVHQVERRFLQPGDIRRAAEIALRRALPVVGVESQPRLEAEPRPARVVRTLDVPDRQTERLGVAPAAHLRVAPRARKRVVLSRDRRVDLGLESLRGLGQQAKPATPATSQSFTARALIATAPRRYHVPTLEQRAASKQGGGEAGSTSRKRNFCLEDQTKIRLPQGAVATEAWALA